MMRCINPDYKRPSYLKGGPDWIEFQVDIVGEGGSSETVMVKAYSLLMAEKETAKLYTDYSNIKETC